MVPGAGEETAAGSGSDNQMLLSMEYYSAEQRKEVLIQSTMWVYFENMMLSEKSQ
jgi:hypothetical protein